MSVHTEIIVDTTKYSGNFSRELSAWVFGVVAEYADPDTPLLEQDPTLAWARQNEKTYESGALELVRNDDHDCWEWENITPTPGWVNDGFGNHRRLKDDETSESVQGTWGAYQSVVWRFTRRLTDEECASVIPRVLSFPEAFVRLSPDYMRPSAPEIEAVRILDVEETRTEHERERVHPA
jgi:hypothetical protein